MSRLKDISFEHFFSVRLSALGVIVIMGLIAAFAILTLAGCLPISQTLVDHSFGGLNATLDETAVSGGLLRVLSVHGMGYHEAGYSEKVFNGLARRLHLHRVTGSDRTNSIINQGLLFGYLRTVDYANGARRLRVYEVTWSPITYWVKIGQFGYDESFTPKRQLINGILKDNLMDFALSDAILYAGAYRTNMQFPIKVAVKDLLEDGFGANDQLAIITFSLGSYMTFDTLRALHDEEMTSKNLGMVSRQIETLADQTTHIYMLANQLPLLELTELSEPIGLPDFAQKTQTVSRVRTLLSSALENQKVGSPLRDFISIRERLPRNMAAEAPVLKKLQIVAFSDPNDLLSFPLQSQNYYHTSPGTEATAANVDLVIARWSLLGIVSNPLTAHTGWDEDCSGLDLMAFGVVLGNSK
jgi:hypothetical protein